MAPGRLQLSVHASAAVASKPKTDLVLIPGGKGKATHLKKGDIIKVINTHGKQVTTYLRRVGCPHNLPHHTCTTALSDATKYLLCWQVVDFWAFSTEEWGKEIMSMHHTRNALQKMTPQVRQEPANRLHPSSTAVAAFHLHLLHHPWQCVCSYS